MSLVCWVLLFSYTSTPLWASFCFRLQQFTLRLTCKCVCLYVEPVSRFKDYVRPVSRFKDYARSLIKSWFRCMPVHICVTECVWNRGYICHWGNPLWRCTFVGGYVPFHLLNARWSYCRWFRPLLLCPLSDECHYFPTQALWDPFCFRLQQFTLKLPPKCVYVCVYMLSQFWVAECARNRGYRCHWGALCQYGQDFHPKYTCWCQYWQTFTQNTNFSVNTDKLSLL